jgi:DNA-directed RNA polymerase subunit RPC12/RpoP
MSDFKHHKYFVKERQLQRYLFPFVCFTCRKSYRKPHTLASRYCPQCSTPMTMLGRKFHTPKMTAIDQWKKVQYLARHGFLFQSIYKTGSSGSGGTVPYPVSLAEAPQFVLEYRDQAVEASPTAWATPRTAILGTMR